MRLNQTTLTFLRLSDKQRIPKSLNTSHPLGATPFVGVFDSEKEEAAFIAFEIKRCVANMGGVLKWGDFVILLRFNALSRPIEAALQKEGIPCRILGGHKFFERVEVGIFGPLCPIVCSNLKLGQRCLVVLATRRQPQLQPRVCACR
jgi:superfamily I DNA/RNA helicase